MSASDRDAVRLLAARDDRFPAVGVLLDADALSERIGAPVRLTAARYKPGESIVVAFDDADGSAAWAAAWTGSAKAEKAWHRASRRGFDLAPVPSLPDSLTGPAWADRELARSIARVRRRKPWLLAGARVLRHNPYRRLVVQAQGRVLKIAAPGAGGGDVDLLARLADNGAAVLVPRAHGPGVTSTAFWGVGDLEAAPSSEAAAAAGRALAAVHASGTRGETSHGRQGAPDAAALRTASDAGAQRHRAAREIAVLAPELGARARALALSLRPLDSDRVRLHGDFSADQVLVGRDDIRLIDFDRACWGAPERDLGSFLAAEMLRGAERAGLGAALLRAYREAGRIVDAAALRREAATALLLRATEPFRRGRADWGIALGSAVRRSEELAADQGVGASGRLRRSGDAL